ncbi:MAG: Eco29kI family restriction endonuclease [Candidatus Methanoplasma sp.]|jgi:hypothetical protein|nr:Eco29kI family restriction endonuclease [Candidatus Methanoplasma sp.]
MYDDYVLPNILQSGVVDTAISFLNSRKLLDLPLPEATPHPGVYAIYYFGADEVYRPLADVNNNAKSLEEYCPIYVGKAVPVGSRTGRTKAGGQTLYHRLSEHAKSIQSSNLDIKDFKCRFAIMTGNEIDLVVPLESELIRRYSPLWNSRVSGFGIHHPGSGRRGQRKSEWDTLHPGRCFADTLTGESQDLGAIKEKIELECAELAKRRL